jgi:O-6-methylguanine DNA methyltransferase
MKLSKTEIATPVGRLLLAATDRGICAVLYSEPKGKGERWLTRRFGTVEFDRSPSRDRILDRAEQALARYFAGDARALDQIPIDSGGTDFQRSVWNALRKIPAGQTRTYGQIARSIGRPTAVRAVGMANRTNPVAIVVPCHRVIGADGSLTGYAGRIDRKEWLLRHEGARLV